MVASSEVTDAEAVDVLNVDVAATSSKISQPLGSVFLDEDDSEVSEEKQVEKDDRNDLATLCLMDNACADLGCVDETRVEVSEEQGNSAAPTSDSSKREETSSSYFDSLCVQPLDMFVDVAKVATRSETKSKPLTEQDETIDDASIVSVGNLFDDLASLPSLASVGAKFSMMEENQDSNALLAAVEDLTLTSDEPREEPAGSLSTPTPLKDRSSSTDSAKSQKNLESDTELITSDLSYSNSKSRSFPRARDPSSLSATSVSGNEKPTSSERLFKKLHAAREEHGRYNVKSADLTTLLGNSLYESEDYSRAYNMYKEALSVYSVKLGDAHETTIDCRIHLGEALEKLGKYDAALQEYHTVLTMRKDLKGVKDPSVGDAMVMISRVLREKEGRIPQALKELKKALKLYRSSLGDSNVKVAATVDDIASLYMMSGDFVKAIAILEEVVKLKAATNGMMNANVASTLTQLAIAQKSAGDTENTLKSLKKAYSIYTTVYGEDSEETTEALQKLAHCYMEHGDSRKAISACMGVLNSKKRILGNTDPSLADNYLDLGVCLQQDGDLNKASKCLKLALTLCVGANGGNTRDSATIAHIMHELGVIHQLNGNTKDAVKVFQQELVIRRKMGASELPQVARTLFHLGTAKHDLGECPSALSDLNEALGIYEKLGDNLGMDFAETLFSTGLVFMTTKKENEKALEAFLESLRLFYAHGLANDHELVQMATDKLKELGHKCECQYRMCTRVPCRTTGGALGTKAY